MVAKRSYCGEILPGAANGAAAVVENGSSRRGMALSSSTAALFYCGPFLLRPFSIAAAAVEEETAIPLLLRLFYCGPFLLRQPQ